MPMQCCVPFCKQRGVRDGNGCKVSFFCFPRDPVQRKRWVMAIKRDKEELFSVTKYTKVCSNHFTTDSYLPGVAGNRRFLKLDAVPTVFACGRPKAAARKKPSERLQIAAVRAVASQLRSSELRPIVPTFAAVPNTTASRSATLAVADATDARMCDEVYVITSSTTYPEEIEKDLLGYHVTSLSLACYDPPTRSTETQATPLISDRGTQTPKMWENCRASSSFFTCSSCGSVFVHDQYRDDVTHVCRDGKTMCRFCKCSCDRRDDEAAAAGMPFVCKQCSKVFALKRTLKTHVREVHKGSRRHVCSVCECSFQRKQHLDDHHRVHTKERPHVCVHCGKAFAQANHLDRHSRIHTGQKPYGCVHCGDRFNQIGHLRKHLVYVHTKEFPHRCTMCDRGFFVPVQLKRHLLTHTKWVQ